MGEAVILKKGAKANLPTEALVNELLFTTDTHELYRGRGTGQALGKVSDVYAFADVGSFPATGMVDKLYIAKDTRAIYVWTGSAYQTASDAHTHSNKTTLDLISYSGGYFNYNSAALAWKSEVDDALALKADLVDGLVPLSQLPSSVKETKVVADITARDAISGTDLFESLLVWVVDATDDTSVASGAALYIYDGSAWQKTAEAESMDVDLSPYMLIADYDSNADGIVDSADEVNGVQSADNSSYYGKNAAGTVGFHVLPVFEWGSF